MPPITLEIPTRTPSRKRGFSDLHRRFIDEGEAIGGELVLPFLSEFDRLGVTVKFDSGELGDVFHPTSTHQEAHRVVVYDWMAIDAITKAIDSVLPKGMAN